MSHSFCPGFALEYDIEQSILAGHWLDVVEDETLCPTYERLVSAAKAYSNCRWWLLDMRRCGWPQVQFIEWYGELMASQVVKLLGQPVFVAYLVPPGYRQAIGHTATQVVLQQMAQVQFYPYFFDTETTARDWLAHYQVQPLPAPALPQP